MKDCEDYHCRCSGFVPDESGKPYTSDCARCWCAEEDHGKGFRGAEQHEADEAREAVIEVFGRFLSLN